MPRSDYAVRILDAALNRAGEGLRVVEDYVRFVLDDAHLTGEVKRLRHDLADAAAGIPAADRHAARDTPHDVGTGISTPSEGRRPDAWAVCQASLERAKQALRSLEEFGKVALPAQAAAFEALRYRLYTVEAAIGRTVDAGERLAGVTLCVLIDGFESDTAFAKLVRDLIDAGVGAIQLRDKQLPVRQLLQRARMLVALAREAPHSQISSGSLPLEGRAGEGVGAGYPLQTPLPNPPHRGEGTGREMHGCASAEARRTLVIINDRPAVAAAAGADGVHLGQDDFAVKDARAVLGPRKLVGVSTHSIEQARQAVLDGANYIGVGPTFPSATKRFTAFPGVELLRTVAAEIRLPAFAIGGIEAANIRDVLATGMTRVAISAAVAAAPSPGDAARQLLAALGESPVEPPPRSAV